MQLSLIANMGIQFYKTKLVIDPNRDEVSSLRFYEWFDPKTFENKLDLVYYLADSDIYVSKKQLAVEGYIQENGKLLDEININCLTPLTLGENCYSINDVETMYKGSNKDTLVECIENKWIPLPYFEKTKAGQSLFSATNWCRLKLIPISKKGETRTYEAVLAFDTKSVYDEESVDTPVFFGNDATKDYGMCNDEDLLLDFCRSEGAWVDDYLLKLMFEDESVINEAQFPLKYRAFYIYFLYYLQTINVLPEVTLFSDKTEEIDINMVIDVGNSKTCVLFSDNHKFEYKKPFTRVKMLELQDLSEPFKSYAEPFDMRLVFHKADFGDMGAPNSNKFAWPGFVRVGKEASRLIYQTKNYTTESQSFHSSPKRYLWDTRESKYQWEFLQSEEDELNPMKAVFCDGISQQFKSNGSLIVGNKSEQFGAKSLFSKQSLMTFVFIEILAQAKSFINSHEFRKFHGAISSPRKIKSIVVSCPTAMPREEQIALRRCAEEASVAIKRFYDNCFYDEYNPKQDHDKVEIVPSVKDLSYNQENIKEKKDWTYDEATCGQMVFLYGEIAQRYKNNCADFFNLYGKYRSDLDNYDKKSLTIGSIDIGAGTTDLMVCTYKYEGEGKGQSALHPIPLFWESFYYAGDDLLKEVIRHVLLENSNPKYSGCSGVIYNQVCKTDSANAKEKMNNFFGVDNNTMSDKARAMRSDFNVQISIPIAYKFLEFAQKDASNTLWSFADLFPEEKPSKELLDFFGEYFGFRFEDLKWEFNLDRMNEIIIRVFEPLLKKLSSILYAYGCDFVLLAGRPTSLPEIQKLFLKLYPVSPDRLVNLNKYRIGNWYPFNTNSLKDRKTIVAMGALIANLASEDQLGHFKINNTTLRTKILPTSQYIGFFDVETRDIKSVLIEPELNRNNYEVAGLPVYFGSKQLNSGGYPSRMLCVLDFDEDKIKERIERTSGSTDPIIVNKEIKKYKDNIKNAMPFTIRVIRNYRTDRELMSIDSISNDIPTTALKFRQQSMEGNGVSWLDTGEFVLSI